jgi:hypothetical protein
MADVGYRANLLHPAQGVGGSIGDFIALMKPRVMSLVVFMALVGMVLAPQQPHPALTVIALVCIAVGAGASGALNMWYDADIDACMQPHGGPAYSTRACQTPDEGPHVRHGARHRLGCHARALRQLGSRRAPRLHHRLLRPRLHDVAEAAHAAKHRHRRRGGRLSTHDRLGRRHRSVGIEASCFS